MDLNLSTLKISDVIQNNIENNTEKHTYILPTPSDEQQEIINQFQLDKNIKIEAVAGSGKTTTLLLLAKATTKKCLILTYNRDLKDDVFEKIKNYNLECDIYTYHSYASKLYCTTINTDILLKNALIKPPYKKCHYDAVFLDELQDVCIEYYEFIKKFLTTQQLVLVGDRRQCINHYKGATSEYLIDYKKYFNNEYPWVELMLRTSYRMTPAIANFVNKNILNQELIIGGNKKNENILPIYNYSTWNILELVYKLVQKYGPDEVVILKASTKSITEKSPLGKLIQHSNIKFCQKEDYPLDDKVIKGKVLISSFNAFKGRERQCVIVFGFDESHFEYYDKQWIDKHNLPNIIYVAATRAKEALVLIQDDKKLPFRTTNKKIINDTCLVMGQQGKRKIHKTLSREYNVTDLINHRATQDISDLLDLLDIESNHAYDILNFNHLIAFDGYYEDMKNYYSMLINILVSHKLGKYEFQKFKIKNDQNRKYEALIDKDKTLKEWMELVVLLYGLKTGHYFYIDQITNYDWVDESFINQSVDRVINIITENNKNGTFNQTITYQNVSGLIDYVDDSIWLFKCTLELKNEHYIQCACYIVLWYLVHGKLLTGKIYNSRTNELVIVKVSDCEKWMLVLLRNK